MTGDIRIVLFAVLMLGAVASPRTAAASAAPGGNDATYEFAIPGSTLQEGLERLARQSRHRLLYRSMLVEGKTALPLSGIYTVTQALDRLLAGAGLRYQITPGAVVVLEPGPLTGSAAATVEPLPPRAEPLQEIIVTALKRGEPAHQIPQTVHAISGRELERDRMRGIENLDSLVPGVEATRGAGAPVISLRGIRAATSGAATEAPIAVYLDGNYLSQGVGQAGLFFDLDRVEIMPGPQGTLFGRNAAGGAINVVSRKPVLDQASFVAEAETGSKDLVGLTGAWNVPLGQGMAARLAGTTLRQSGFYANGLDDVRQASVRASLRWSPDARSSVLVSGNYTDNSPRGHADNLLATPDGGPVPPLRDNSSLYGDGAAARTDQQFGGVAVEYERDLDFAAITLQVAQRRVDQKDLIYDSENLFDTHESGDSYSVEARLTSPRGGNLGYVAGVFGMYEDKAGGVRNLDGDPDGPPIAEINVLGQRTRALAAFGQAEIGLTERLQLTLGARLNQDKRASASEESVPGARYLQSWLEDSWTRLTWRAGLGAVVRDGGLLYANVANGYKSGGFTYGPTPRVGTQDIVSYEIGLKNRWLEDRLQLNVAAFHYNYQNIEQPYLAPVPGTTALLISTVNIGGARTSGAELDFQWAPAMAARIGLQVQFLDGKYYDFDLTPYGDRDYSDTPVIGSPRWAASLQSSYRYVQRSFRLEPALALRYRGSRSVSGIGRYDAEGSPYRQEATVLTDLSVRYEPTGSAWAVTAFVQNLTDELVVVSGSYDSARDYRLYGQLAAPRTWGLAIQYRSP